MTSLASANGPSVTVGGWPPANRTRAPAAGGCSPSRDSSAPARESSSLKRFIASTTSSVGAAFDCGPETSSRNRGTPPILPRDRLRAHGQHAAAEQRRRPEAQAVRVALGEQAL